MVGSSSKNFVLCLVFIPWCSLPLWSFLSCRCPWWLCTSLDFSPDLFLHSLSLVKLWIVKLAILHLGDYSFHSGNEDQMWCFPLAGYFSLFFPVPPTSHDCSFCSRNCSYSLSMRLVLPLIHKAVVPAAAYPSGSRSTEPKCFCRNHLWTAVFHDALLWILEDPVF